MLIRWRRSLALSLGMLVTQAQAADPAWRVPFQGITTNPNPSSGPVAAIGRPIVTAPTSSALLGKPIPQGGETIADPMAILDQQVRPTGFSNPPGSRWTVRARGEDSEEDVQPAATNPPRSGLTNPLFTGSQASDEMAPPPRLERGAPPPPPPSPPKVSDYFPVQQDIPPFGVGPVMPPGPPAIPAGPMIGGPSLGSTGAYPGNELYLRGEALLWWYKGGPVPTLGTQGVPGAASSVAAIGDNRFENKPFGGGRLMGGYWFDDDHCWGIEGGFFVLGQNSQTQSISSLGQTVLALPFTNVGPGGVGTIGPPFPIAGPVFPGINNVGAMQLKYDSRFYGYEANLRGFWCRGPSGFIDCLVGFRGLDLNDNLDFSAVTSGITIPGNPAVFAGSTQRAIADQFSTQNRFYGGQIGTVMEYRHGCWVFDLTAKLALGVTRETVSISGSTTDSVFGGATTSLPTGFYAQASNIGRYSKDVFAVVPELGMTAGYQITPRLRGFVGYNILYWSRVARPGQQINTLINNTQIPGFQQGMLPGPGTPPAPTFAFHQDSFWAQGLTFGLEWRF